MKNLGILLLITGLSLKALSFPDICNVLNSKSFRSCLQLRSKLSLCGWPFPRPCISYSYYVPQYFTEVVSSSHDTFFNFLPKGVFGKPTINLPFSAEDDEGSYSFHAHTINVPFTSLGFVHMPCGGTPIDLFCHSSKSEHLGRPWLTGEGDKFQPKHWAWSLSPKACLVKGAIQGATGGSSPTHYPNLNSCSFPRGWQKTYPPSTQPVCTGWGIHFPRYGTVTSSDQTTASLLIASRMRSLASEVFMSVPTSHDEKWQMLYPNQSDCFREGQNIGALRLKTVNERGRVSWGMQKNYRYVNCKKVSCKQELFTLASTYAGLEFMKALCHGIK